MSELARKPGRACRGPGEEGELLPPGGARRIVKNFVSQAGSNLAAQGLAFLSTAYVARCLEAEGFGWIGFAQGFLAYFTLATDLGLRTVGMREVARHPEDVPKWVGHILGLRLALASLSATVFVVIVSLLPVTWEFRGFLLAYGLMIYTSALLLDWAFQGLERMEVVALGEVLRAGSYLGLVLLALHRRSEILRIPVFTVASQLVPVLLLVALYCRQFRQLRPRMDVAVWKDLLRQSLPISLGGLVLQIATGVDVVLLGLLHSAAEIGYYSAAFRLAFVPTSFTTVLGFAVFPIMARYWQEQPAKLAGIATRLSQLLLLMSLPIVIAGWLLAPSLLSFVYGGGFSPAGWPFRILLGYLLVAHLYCAFYYLLPACGKQKAFMKCMMTGAVVGVAANLALIPLYGSSGAAGAKVVAHLAVFVVMYRTTWKEIAPVPLFREVCSSALLAAPMVPLILLSPAPPLANLVLALIAYASLVVIWHRKAGSEILGDLVARSPRLREEGGRAAGP